MNGKSNMKTFKTDKGIELPLLDLRGKPYLQVAHRLVWFRSEHPDWTIETSLIESTDTHSISKAIIKDASGKVMATAHKQETRQGFADHLEKSETGAVGRALAMCGYGTQFAPEFDEEDRLADAPVDRIQKRPEREEAKVTATDQTGPCSEKQAKMIYAKAKAKNISDDKLKDLLIQVAGVRETSKVPWGVLDKVLNEIAAYKAH